MSHTEFRRALRMLVVAACALLLIGGLVALDAWERRQRDSSAPVTRTVTTPFGGLPIRTSGP